MKTKTQHIRIKFPEGIKDKVKEWCSAFIVQEGFNQHSYSQNIYVESVYLDEQPGGVYLIFGLKAKTLHQAHQFLTKLNRSLSDFTKRYLPDPNRKALSMISYLNNSRENE